MYITSYQTQQDPIPLQRITRSGRTHHPTRAGMLLNHCLLANIFLKGNGQIIWKRIHIRNYFHQWSRTHFFSAWQLILPSAPSVLLSFHECALDVFVLSSCLWGQCIRLFAVCLPLFPTTTVRAKTMYERAGRFSDVCSGHLDNWNIACFFPLEQNDETVVSWPGKGHFERLFCTGTNILKLPCSLHKKGSILRHLPNNLESYLERPPKD